MRHALQHLDRLTRERAITGYTLEPEPAYLRAGQPTVSYAMYAFDRVARSNLHGFLADMTRLGAVLTLHHTIGSTGWPGGILKRTDQLTAVAWLPGCRALGRAVGLLNLRYVARSPRAVPGSWMYPDARICGIDEEVPATIAAFAHQLRLPGGSAVVLSRAETPPLPGMRTHPVRLLAPWKRYLEGQVFTAAGGRPRDRPARARTDLLRSA